MDKVSILCRRCGHLWEYKGKSKYYATCPNCHSNIKIQLMEEKKDG